MAANQEVVRKFIEAVNANDKQRILSFFDDESVFHNIPMEPARGRDAIWAILAIVHDHSEQVDWVVHNIAQAENGHVLTERTDRYRMGGRWVEFPVMGIFEVRDGTIREWRDYFDLKQCTDQMPDA